MQSAYREGYFTEASLLHIHNDILCEIDIRSQDLEWVDSYLDECKKFVVLLLMGTDLMSMSWIVMAP